MVPRPKILSTPRSCAAAGSPGTPAETELLDLYDGPRSGRAQARDPIYGSDTGNWTTEMFIEAAYKSLRAGV